jgi:hypothetical protein
MPEPTQENTPTSLPTATFTPTLEPTATPIPPTDTPEPTPTSTPDRKATESALATADAEETIARISETLEEIGLTTEGGSLGWVQTEQISFDLDSHSQMVYDVADPDLVAADFVYKMDIGWDSSGGLAGCGLIFRSEENFERGAQYQFNTIRLSGFPGWDIERWEYGQFQFNITRRILTSQAINQDSGAVNEFIVVAKGNAYTVYANGDRLSTATDSKIAEGRFGFLAFQDSGSTTCTFRNGWVWLLE